MSVVLSVRNGAAELPHAIASILQQSFADFELIAINDGSTDGTAEILDRVRDPRVRVVHQDEMGLARALNRGVALARGQYIARQDHDDLAMPLRLARQVAFMEANPGCALVGTRAEIRVDDRPGNRFHDHPADDAALRFELLFDNPFVHSSVMLRKSAVQAAGGYSTDPARQPPEDYELWSRLARHWQVANLPERLTIYRETAGGMSRAPRGPFREKVVLISAENLAAAVGETAPARLHRDIAALTHGAFALMSHESDIDGMCRTVEQAGARIHANAPGSDVPRRAAKRIKMLRRQYIQCRCWKILGPVWPVARLGWRYSGMRELRRRPKASRS
ncbi:MAG TPA: glycosyltransferase [Xanthobacteraceae bacterium]|nr:glycosyltransferase [Xanthobacteraceae bacterium]